MLAISACFPSFCAVEEAALPGDLDPAMHLRDVDAVRVGGHVGGGAGDIHQVAVDLRYGRSAHRSAGGVPGSARSRPSPRCPLPARRERGPNDRGGAARSWRDAPSRSMPDTTLRRSTKPHYAPTVGQRQGDGCADGPPVTEGVPPGGGGTQPPQGPCRARPHDAQRRHYAPTTGRRQGDAAGPSAGGVGEG
jgi:hypothetical protein